jgi:hypothetical protein
MFQGLSLQYPDNRYDLVIPGSEIPEWFTHQSMGDEANIKEPSNLCNEWMGIALCVVFHSHPHHQVQNQPGQLNFWLTANGKRRFPQAFAIFLTFYQITFGYSICLLHTIMRMT